MKETKDQDEDAKGEKSQEIKKQRSRNIKKKDDGWLLFVCSAQFPFCRAEAIKLLTATKYKINSMENVMADSIWFRAKHQPPTPTPLLKAGFWKIQIAKFDFDVCVTVHLWYNSMNNQLDATITID